MAVALRKPQAVDNLISVDNAPVDAALKSDFGKYIQGMRKVEEAKIQKQSEADEILKPFEQVTKSLKFRSNVDWQLVWTYMKAEFAHPPVPPDQSRKSFRRLWLLSEIPYTSKVPVCCA